MSSHLGQPFSSFILRIPKNMGLRFPYLAMRNIFTH